jgi:NDP-sugar pyrophosphorylase family protein
MEDSKRYGILWEYDDVFDLEPFPSVPVGALWAGDMYVVSGALHLLYSLGTTDVIVATKTGAVYLTEAIGHYEKYNSMSYSHFSDVDEKGAVSTLAHAIGTNVNDTSNPIVMLPGNIITDIKLDDVERFHRGKGRRIVTMVVTQGRNTTDLELPQGYRPTNLMLVEKKLYSLASRVSSKIVDLLDLVKLLEDKGQVDYYTFDGFLFEVNTPEEYLLLRPNAEEGGE